MSILFVLLMFLLIMTFSYLRQPSEQPVVKPEVWAKPQPPRMEREFGFDIPQGYCFHPGHTWVLKETTDNARVGIDSFATRLMGRIDHIDVVGPNRWVRQGQKLVSIISGDTTIDMLSPVEGVVTSINSDVLRDPNLVAQDPYKDGWIAMVKSPDLAINQKNLVQGIMVAPWMQNNVTRLNASISQASPALAQDGGVPVSGILGRLAPELKQKLVKEFFLS